jgi:class 3 adenylate cyclase/DNA-binding CsgD family transcriptional regulator
MALPTGTVTMLFTDIEGSTRLLKQLGERYGDLLADHRRLLREAFAAHDGHEIGTEGDSFFVTFARARDAVEAAVDGQRALARHRWPDGLEPHVRMGMHTGEPSIGEVGYHGIGVHRGARVASAAHGGQVLLSSATAELVQDDLPAGVSLLSLGAQQLKDIDRPETLYQLVADGLRADFPSPKAPATLVGRDDECALLDGVLEAARGSQSRALAIRGEAGVGKSALLAYAVERADGFLVLRATGFEGEAELAFSGLLQLLRPLAERIDELPPHQAAALGGALGLSPGELTDRLTIGVATMALVALAAEDADVLLAVDDAQWLDSASSDAILFAARRLEADRVAVVLTVRDDRFLTAGLEELRLAGLRYEASRRLVPHLTERLYQLTQGNPLALVELPEALTDAQLDGAEPLNLGARVERAFRGRVQALSAAAQRALLVAAANDSDRLDAVVALGVDWRALGEAEDAGLVTLTGEAVSFRHPLVRSAVYHSAAPSERRAAHAALAGAVGDIERRAWHLASAAIGPDEEVAEALEQAAAAAQGRSGYGAASSAYERAARLSPEPRSRVRRLLAAGEAAWNAGRTPRAIELLDEALAGCDDDDVVLRGHLLNARGHIERHTSNPAAAYAMLVEAAGLLDEASPLDAATARVGAWRAAVLLSDRNKRRAVAEALSERAEADGGLQEFFSSLVLGAETQERALLERAETLFEEQGGELFAASPRYVSLAGMASQELGAFERGLAVSTAAIGWAREHGVHGALPVALMRRAWFETALGAWPAAYATLLEALEVAVQQETFHFVRSILLDLATLDARRGDEAACRRHVQEAGALLEPLGWTDDPGGRERLAILELGLGRLDTAVELYESVPGRGTADLAEAHARSGRRAEALTLLATLESDADPRVGRVRGLLADDDGFDRHFKEALELHGARATRFEEARTRLCYGERLRRAGRRRDARDQLRPALEAFEQLGAIPWAEQARAELRATGERVRARGPEHEELTAQELRIALQAAEGKTNRQIGAALYLSPKTVEFHLGRAYRKLGISSRAELIRHFATANV